MGPGCVNGLKEFLARLVELAGGFIIGLFEGDCIQGLEGHIGFEAGCGVRQGLEFFIGGHHVFVPVALGEAALGVGDFFREETGAVEIEVWG